MLEIKNLKKSYLLGKEKVPVLNGVHFQVNQGTFLALLGPSGCGKSTLLNILGGLDTFDEGEIIVNGENLTTYYKEKKEAKLEKYRLENIGTIFQSFNLISHMTAFQNVEVPMKLAGLSKQEIKTRAKELLGSVGLEDRMNYKPSQLSGGQKQRVAIARALALNPNIILADEPTGALDSKTSEQIINLLRKISDENGTTIIMVTHDREVANQADKIVTMKDGEVVEEEILHLKETKEIKNQNKFKNMNLRSSIKHATQAMFQKKWRNLLVSIGGSIGIAGIALIVGLGMGIEEKAKDIIGEFLQENAIIVTKDGKEKPITFEDSQKIKNIDGIEEVQNVYSFTVDVGNTKNIMAGGMISGINTKQMNTKMMKSMLVKGTYPAKENEMAIDKNIAIRFVKEGQKPEHIIGKELTLPLKGLTFDKDTGLFPFKGSENSVEATFKITGVTKSGESYILTNKSEKLSKEIFEGTPTPIKTLVTTKTVEEVEGVKTEIEKMHMKAQTNEDMIKEISKISLIIQVSLGAFAGISLIVSTIMIGIVLYISVIERVKEIGILRAIGARRKDIRRIFLTEASLIGFFSAAIGLIFSAIGVLIGNQVLSMFLEEEAFNAFTLPFSLIGFCLIFSVLLSMFAGLIPARKATKLNPVEALRHE